MRHLPPEYTTKKLERYTNDYLLKFFDDIQNNTVVYYGKCGEFYDYLEPLITELFPSLKLEYIDPDHHLHNYVNDAFVFLVKTSMPAKMSIQRSDVIPKDPVLFDIRELVVD